MIFATEWSGWCGGGGEAINESSGMTDLSILQLYQIHGGQLFYFVRTFLIKKKRDERAGIKHITLHSEFKLLFFFFQGQEFF